MKVIIRTLFITIVAITIAPDLLAQRRSPRPAISGVYEAFSVGQGSGDLERMRVVIFAAHDEYYAIAQIAQGGAEDPTPDMVKAKVKGTKVVFTVDSVTYVGTVSSTGLKVNGLLLKRKPCADFFR